MKLSAQSPPTRGLPPNMRISLVSRIVSWIGGGLMIVLVLQATGLLDVINSHVAGSGKPKDGAAAAALPHRHPLSRAPALLGPTGHAMY